MMNGKLDDYGVSLCLAPPCECREQVVHTHGLAAARGLCGRAQITAPLAAIYVIAALSIFTIYFYPAVVILDHV